MTDTIPLGQLVVRLKVPVKNMPVGTELGYRDVADAIAALGSAAFFDVVRDQQGNPIPPLTPEEIEEATRAAQRRAKSRRLILGADFDPLWNRVEGIPSAEELTDMQAAVDAVADVPPRVEAVEATVSSVAPKAERADSRVFDVRAYGAVGDGTTDDTDALQACATACRAAGGTYHLPAHMTCRITAMLDLRMITDVDVRGVIKVAHTTGVGVQVGNSASTRQPTHVLLNEVTYAGTQSNITVRIAGIKNGKVTITRSEYVQLYADVNVASMSSIAYSDITLGDTRTLELFGEPGLSWINQNTFHGRVQFLRLMGNGEYMHNANNFDGLNLESSQVQIDAGHSNTITGRFEGTSTATFHARTFSNRIIQEWSSNRNQMWPSVTWTDNGFDNRVILQSLPEHPVAIFSIDAGSRTTDVASAWPVGHATRRIRPGFRKLTITNAFTDYADTGIFPLESKVPLPNIEGGTWMRRFRFVSDAALWRPKVFVYDANMQPLDGASTEYMSLSGGWTWNAGLGSYVPGSNINMARMVFSNPTVKYARITFYANATGTFTYATLQGYAQAPHDDRIAERIHRQMQRPLYKTGATPPAQSLLYPGDSIGTDSGRLILTHRVDTTLAADADAAATSITVADGTGIANGDAIAVLLSDDTTHFTTVSDISANTITLAAGLAGAASAGANVATQRWTHLT